MCEFTDSDPYIARLRASNAELHEVLAEAIRTATQTRDALNAALRIVPFTPASAEADPYVQAVAGTFSEQGASA